MARIAAPVLTIAAGLTAGLLMGQGLLPPPPIRTAEAMLPLSGQQAAEDLLPADDAPDYMALAPAIIEDPAEMPAASARADASPVLSPEAIVPAAFTARDAGGIPAWQRMAVAIEPQGGPMIAIVIDDLGLDLSGTQEAVDLPAPVTLAFLTYAENLGKWSRQARGAGHELLLHVPMEPLDGTLETGPKALKTGLPQSELQSRLDWGMARLEGFVGVNNHMGSRFTSDPQAMGLVMETLHEKGYLFLDSLTSGASQGWRAAATAGVPYAVRDVFLDDVPNSRLEVRRQLARLERIARRRGHAIAIGHPHAVTLSVLRDWMAEARSRGFDLVPVSAIVRRAQTMASSDGADSG